MAEDNAARVFSLFVADALEALIPLVDDWAAAAERQSRPGAGAGYTEAYRAGVRAMSREVKDQLVERILRLREP